MFNLQTAMQNNLDIYIPEKDMILRDRISRYITLHPHGVCMNELETIFGESRMRLGYILNKLNEESRIRKTSNVYFPFVGGSNNDTRNRY
jgi:hypothetical protein